MNFLKDLASQHSSQNSGTGGSQVAHPTGALQGAEPTKSGGDGGLMGKLAGVMGGSQNQAAHPTGAVQGAESGGGGLFDKLNSAMGGGKSSEAKEDYLDKGVDWMQEHMLGQGQQSNESALEQAKDEQISDAIRRGFKSATGRDIPIKDKS